MIHQVVHPAGPLPRVPRQQLAAAVEHEGSIRIVAKTLRLPYMTVRRAHRGKRLQQGSIALICAALAREIAAGAWADVEEFHAQKRRAA